MSAPANKPAPRFWTADEEERLRHLREVEGLTVAMIADKMARGRESIRAKIGILGLRLPPQGYVIPKFKPVTPRKMELARRQWANGTCIKDAAAEVDLSDGTMQRLYCEFANEERETISAHNFGGYIGYQEMLVIAGSACGINPRAIIGSTRHKANVCARIAVARALRDRGISMKRIATRLGRTDHSTVLNMLRKFDSYCRVYPETRRAYEAIKAAEVRASERLAA